MERHAQGTHARERHLLVVNDLYDAIVAGVAEIDEAGPPKRHGSDEYYDRLATAITAYVTTECRPGKAHENVADMIKHIEDIALIRSQSRLILKLRR